MHNSACCIFWNYVLNFLRLFPEVTSITYSYTVAFLMSGQSPDSIFKRDVTLIVWTFETYRMAQHSRNWVTRHARHERGDYVLWSHNHPPCSENEKIGMVPLAGIFSVPWLTNITGIGSPRCMTHTIWLTSPLTLLQICILVSHKVSAASA